MAPPDASLLGVLLIAAGAGLALVVYVLLRLIALGKIGRPGGRVQGARSIPAGSSSRGSAAILVGGGGWVLSASPAACRLFGLEDDILPGLEWLAARMYPSEEFLRLCGREGQASLELLAPSQRDPAFGTVNRSAGRQDEDAQLLARSKGQQVEAVSYFIPGEPLPSMLVVLHSTAPDGPEPAGQAEKKATPEVLRTVMDAGQLMLTSLDLPAAAASIVENTCRLLQADTARVTVWDSRRENLASYWFEFSAAGGRMVGKISATSPLKKGVTVQPGDLGEDSASLASRLMIQRQPILAADLQAYRPGPAEAGFALEDFWKQAEARSYLGIPLLVGGNELVGALELGCRSAALYQNSDLDVVQLLAGPAAAALRNALAFKAQAARAEELAGLAELAQAFGALRDFKDLFTHLVNSIAPLVAVDVLGFLVYMPESSQLIGQDPFKGLPEPFLPVYHLTISTGSPAERLLVSQKPVICDDAAHDLDVAALGMTFLVEAASLRDCAFIPLVSGGRMVGYLQASNHTDGSRIFSQDELHLLVIVANQAAPIIENAFLLEQLRSHARQLADPVRLNADPGAQQPAERTAGLMTENEALATLLARQTALALENARLLQGSEQRAHQMQALANTAAAISSALQIDELITTLLVEFQKVVPFDTATLWLKEGEALIIAAASGFPDNEQRLGLRVEVEDSLLFREMVTSCSTVVVADQRTDERFPSGMGEAFRSWLGVPLISKGEAVGAIALEKIEPGFYLNEHVQGAWMFASQAAAALENAHLFAQTIHLAETLEQRVAERAAALSREHQRTTALLRITTTLSTSLSVIGIDLMMEQALLILVESLGGRRAAVYTTNSSGQLAPRAWVNPGGKDWPPSRSGQAVAQWVTRIRRPVFLDDLPGDPRWQFPGETPDPLEPGLLAAPLILGDEITGALLVYFAPLAAQSSADVLELVQAAARQMAVALNNAELYTLVRDQSDRLGAMFQEQQIDASRAHAILEGVADGVLVTDAQNRVVLLNASAGRMLQVDATQAAGQPLESLAGMFGPAFESWIQAIRSRAVRPQAGSSGQGVQLSYGDQADVFFEQRITLANDRVISIHLSPVFLRADLLATVSVFRDISSEVEMDRLKSEFLANVSHELRTPLTSIKGYVELLLAGAGGPLGEQQSAFLRVAENNIRRLTSLVNDLLDVSQLEAGRSSLSLRHAINLGHVAGEVLESFIQRSQQESKPMQFRLDVEPDLPQVKGDEDRIYQIIYNLVSNAYHYTPDGGQVTVRLTGLEDEVKVDVLDTGIGLSSIDRGRLFERFYRGEHTLVQAAAGVGLGLTLTRKLVELHGGQIWCEDRPDQNGSIFSFTLPALYLDSTSGELTTEQGKPLNK